MRMWETGHQGRDRMLWGQTPGWSNLLYGVGVGVALNLTPEGWWGQTQGGDGLMIGKMLRQRKQHLQSFRGQGFPGCPESKESPTMQETWVWSLIGTIPWGRKWQPTPVFLPGEPHGQSSKEGYNPWGCKELDTTEWLTLSLSFICIESWCCMLLKNHIVQLKYIQFLFVSHTSIKLGGKGKKKNKKASISSWENSSLETKPAGCWPGTSSLQNCKK